MLHFRYRYFICALLLFCIEVLIALFVHDEIIRPHIGDLLVVIMIYCFLRAFFNVSVWKTALITLLFSYLIEVLQYFNIVEVLGLQQSLLARVVIGTYFSWIDMLAYTTGIIIVLITEKIIAAKQGIKKITNILNHNIQLFIYKTYFLSIFNTGL